MIDVERVVYFITVATLVIGFMGMIIKPFKEIMDRNEKTMKKQNDSIDALNKTLLIMTRDLDDSKMDRASIHKILKAHEEILDKHNESLIVTGERVRHLFHKGGLAFGYENEK